ncbi:unnamed protein product [Ixodes pacificus]
MSHPLKNINKLHNTLPIPPKVDFFEPISELRRPSRPHRLSSNKATNPTRRRRRRVTTCDVRNTSLHTRTHTYTQTQRHAQELSPTRQQVVTPRNDAGAHHTQVSDAPEEDESKLRLRGSLRAQKM